MIAIIASISLLGSCGPEQMPFDPAGWNEPIDMGYKYRTRMLNDLVENYLQEGMTKTQAIQLMGPPLRNSKSDLNVMRYEIEEEYGMRIDPVHGSTLVLTLENDSVVVNVEIVDW